jgi:hypothetical protein
MAASVQIDETNGSGAGTVTGNISNTNMGSTDAPNLNPATFPITPGTNTFEKYQQFHLTALNGSTQIQNLRVWRTGSLGGSAVHVTNARSSGYVATTSYTQPIATTSTAATQTMPTSQPGSANLGIAGSLGGALSSPGFSDYLIHQIQSNSGDTSGSTTTQNYMYDEVA